MSLFEKLHRFRVVCNDLALRSAVVGRAFIANGSVTVERSDLALLLREPGVACPRVAEERYSPSVFSCEHARLIDRVLWWARSDYFPEGNDRVHGYQPSRLYSPWANLRGTIEASEATTPAAVHEFQNSDLGEPFVPPGGGVSVDVLDRCLVEDVIEYAGQPCDMGVDVGLKLHVVVQEAVKRDDEAVGGPPLLRFTGELDGFQGLDALMERFNTDEVLAPCQ